MKIVIGLGVGKSHISLSIGVDFTLIGKLVIMTPIAILPGSKQ
jgi:hypothetical protein